MRGPTYSEDQEEAGAQSEGTGLGMASHLAQQVVRRKKKLHLPKALQSVEASAIPSFSSNKVA